MNLMDFISPKTIKVPLESSDKNGVITELLDELVQIKQVPHRESILEALNEREEAGSTGIGHGVALPHARCPEVKEIYIACGVAPDGIDFDALDREPVYIFFMILAPRSAPGHLKIMSMLTRLLSRASVREQLQQSKTADEVYSVLSEMSD